MTWAVEQKLPAMQKLVLLMLANRTNTDTGLCYPSHDKLAEDCGMTSRSVINQIKKLEELGVVRVIRTTKNGAKQPNKYHLNLNVSSERDSLRGSERDSLRGSERDSLPRNTGAVEVGSERDSLPRNTGAVEVGSERDSLGVVKEVQLGSERGSHKPVTNHKQTNNNVLPKNVAVVIDESLGQTKEAKDLKDCMEWAKNNDYWQSLTLDKNRFNLVYSKPDSKLKAQYELAKEDRQTNVPKPKKKQREVWEQRGFNSEKEFAEHLYNEQMKKYK